MTEAVERLVGELRIGGDELIAYQLANGFLIASHYHVHFYHRDMDLNGGGGWFLYTAKKSVEQFVERMVAISEELDSP
jgi:hypothetical protein